MKILRFERFCENTTNNSMIFSIHKVGNISTLTLLDYTTEKVFGTISFRKVKTNYEVVAIVAEKGYGYLILRTAIMYLSPRGLMPTRDGQIKPAAVKLWQKLYSDESFFKLPSTFSREYSQDITELFIDEFDEINDIDSSDMEDDEMNNFAYSLDCKQVKLNFVFKKEPDIFYMELIDNNKYAKKTSSYYYKLGQGMFQKEYK